MKVLLMGLVCIFASCASQKHSTIVTSLDAKNEVRKNKVKSKEDKKKENVDRFPTSHTYEQARPW